MRIIDWSSDVFSSDLRIDRIRHGNIILYDPVWISTQQDRQGIALAGSLLAKPRKLGLGGSELGLGLPQGQFVNVAPFEPGTLQGHRFAAGCHGALRDLDLTVERAQVEVALGHLPTDRETDGLEIDRTDRKSTRLNSSH